VISDLGKFGIWVKSQPGINFNGISLLPPFQRFLPVCDFAGNPSFGKFEKFNAFTIIDMLT
jgi:hypothetical protein